MRKERRQFWQLLAGLLSLAGLLYLIGTYPPSLTLPTTAVFFALIFAALWFFSKFALKSSIQASLISSVVTSYLIVRALGLKQPFFILLFIILFITLQLFFKRN
ncbi:MAG: hypothetical protein HYU48_00205 [Candidatus Levybacteria bacterium]|nr:hypothetical protein [Candidatus Levybacteria bacterium]